MLLQVQSQDPIHQHQVRLGLSPGQFRRQYQCQNPTVLHAVKRHQVRQRHHQVSPIHYRWLKHCQMLLQVQYQGPIHQHQARHGLSPRPFRCQRRSQNPIVLHAVKRHQPRQRRLQASLWHCHRLKHCRMLPPHQCQGLIHQRLVRHGLSQRPFHRQHRVQSPIVLHVVKHHLHQ